MADYWICDAEQRVLGPVKLAVLQSLLTSGKLAGITQVSIDRGPWEPVAARPELAKLLAEPSPAERRAREREEAVRLRLELEKLRRQSPEQVFGLGPRARIDAWRVAFFRLVKRYFPDNLPADADEDLRLVYVDYFSFLSSLMAWVEKQAEPAPASAPSAALVPVTPPRPAAPPPKAAPPAKPAPAPAKPSPAPTPTYSPSEFIGIDRRREDRIAVDVRVTYETSRIFTESRVSNLSRGGVFIPCAEAPTVGATVDLTLHFDQPAKTVKATGTVSWWSVGTGERDRGFGLKFTELAQDDRRFLEYYLAKAKAAKER